MYVTKSGCRLPCVAVHAATSALCLRCAKQRGVCVGQNSLPIAKPCGRNAKLTRQKFGRGACSFSKRSMSTSCKQQVCEHVSVSVSMSVCICLLAEHVGAGLCATLSLSVCQCLAMSICSLQVCLLQIKASQVPFTLSAVLQVVLSNTMAHSTHVQQGSRALLHFSNVVSFEIKTC